MKVQQDNSPIVLRLREDTELDSLDINFNEQKTQQCSQFGQFHLPPDLISVDPSTLPDEQRESYRATRERVQRSQHAIARRLNDLTDEDPYIFVEGLVPETGSLLARELDQKGRDIPGTLRDALSSNFDDLSPEQKAVFSEFSGAEVAYYMGLTERPRTTTTLEQTQETQRTINEITGGRGLVREVVAALPEDQARELFEAIYLEREEFAAQIVESELANDPNFDPSRPVVIVFGSLHRLADDFGDLCMEFTLENFDPALRNQGVPTS